MREIKFRAFMKKEFSLPKASYDTFTLQELMTGKHDHSKYENWQQFTGLQDKNGVDIYEGDLLREPAKNDWDKKNYMIQEVFWHDNDCADSHIGWQMNRTHYKGSLCGSSVWNKMLPKYTKKMVVIGNIYENPELLKN